MYDKVSSVCVCVAELVKDEYVFGRGGDCDYCFEENGGKSNPHFLAFSNTHFRLYRVSGVCPCCMYVCVCFLAGERYVQSRQVCGLHRRQEVSTDSFYCDTHTLI